MSEANICDRCGKVVKKDYLMCKFIRPFTIKLLKIKPITFEFCEDCVKDFIKFKNEKEVETK